MRIDNQYTFLYIWVIYLGFLLSPIGTVAQWKPIVIEEDKAYPIAENTLFLRAKPGVDARSILAQLKDFQPYKPDSIDLDPAGEFDYWFAFSISSDKSPLYLTLPAVQNFQLELFKVDPASSRLQPISKGGILTPKEEKYILHASELFKFPTRRENGLYLLKINRILYKSFSARVLTDKAMIAESQDRFMLEGILLGAIACVVLYHLLIFLRVREKEYLLLAIYMLFLILQIATYTGIAGTILYFDETRWNNVFYNLAPSFSAIMSFWFSYSFLNISRKRYPILHWVFVLFWVLFGASIVFSVLELPVIERLTIIMSLPASIFLIVTGIIRFREKFRPAGVYVIAYIPTFFSIPYLVFYTYGGLTYSWFTHNNLLVSIALQAILFSLATATKIRMLKDENETLLQEENVRLDQMVKKRTSELESEKQKVEQTLDELKNTQSQLIHAEKMASLGELTAGIAHEIQNPLNFVKNFSELNTELLEELFEELKNGNDEEVHQLIQDVVANEKKVIHHGKRAEEIVTSMLQHSRGAEGKKEPVQINSLADEYLRLAYHGLRAKDKTFNAQFSTDYDENIPLLEVVPQDIGRVLLNIINNAFYAVTERAKASENGYQPTIDVKTAKKGKNVEICISDNGVGIPETIKEKIFQPFFTTKSTGSGTGLGLSLSYDIVTKGHSGTVAVKSKTGEGTEFKILLPIEQNK